MVNILKSDLANYKAQKASTLNKNYIESVDNMYAASYENNLNLIKSELENNRIIKASITTELENKNVLGYDKLDHSYAYIS